MYTWLYLIVIFGLWWIVIGLIGVAIEVRNPIFKKKFLEKMDETIDLAYDFATDRLGFMPYSKEQYRKFGRILYKATPWIDAGRGPLELFKNIRIWGI